MGRSYNYSQADLGYNVMELCGVLLKGSQRSQIYLLSLTITASRKSKTWNVFDISTNERKAESFHFSSWRIAHLRRPFMICGLVEYYMPEQNQERFCECVNQTNGLGFFHNGSA